VHEIEKALDEHLAHAVKTELERRALAQTRGRAIGGIEPRHETAKLRVAPMPQDERVRHRVAERPDAELQGAAVGHRARHMQAGGVVGGIDRLAWRREQAKVRGRGVQHQVEFAFRDVAVAGHEGQFRIDLSHEEEVARLARAARKQIEREVGIAAQAETRLAAAHALGDELRHLDRGIGGRAREQRVGDVIGLAEAERHRQLDIFADARDDRIGQAIRIFERDGPPSH